MVWTHGRGVICPMSSPPSAPALSSVSPTVSSTVSSTVSPSGDPSGPRRVLRPFLFPGKAAAALVLALAFLGCAGPGGDDLGGEDGEGRERRTDPVAVADPRPDAGASSAAPLPVIDPDLADRIAIDGSSTVFPITEAVAAEFEAAAPGVSVRLGVSGTGGGFRKFCRGRIDIADASRPMKAAEAELCRENGIDFVELPVAYDGLTVVVHKDNDFAHCLGVGELYRIWRPESEGEVVHWSQVRSGWPDLPLRLYGAGEDSGTYDYFTAAVVGEEGSSRQDFVASEDDYLIAQDVAADPSALGFFGLAYAREYGDRLRTLAIAPNVEPVPASGPAADECVLPTDDAVRGGAYVPLSRPIFVYVALAALERPAVRAFLDVYLASAPRVVPEVGYVALPARAYELARERLERRILGSLFDDGSEVGVSVERLLELESRSSLSPAEPPAEPPAESSPESSPESYPESYPEPSGPVPP